MDRIVIATSQRCGSNLLIDSLALHPAARSCSEWFNLRLNPDRSRLAEYNLLKLFSLDELQPGFSKVLDSASHVIYLYRINRDAQKLSWQKAAATGRWTAEDELQAPASLPVEGMDYWIDRAEELFFDRACVAVSYEFMTAAWDLTISIILQAVGWPVMSLPMARRRL